MKEKYYKKKSLLKSRKMVKKEKEIFFKDFEKRKGEKGEMMLIMTREIKERKQI